MEYLLAIVVLGGIVALVVLGPLRTRDVDAREDERRAALEAARDSKYREIRDGELDFRMGKVSEADFRATDRELRAQAIEIMKELDKLGGEEPREAAGGARTAPRTGDESGGEPRPRDSE